MNDHPQKCNGDVVAHASCDHSHPPRAKLIGPDSSERRYGQKHGRTSLHRRACPRMREAAPGLTLVARGCSRRHLQMSDLGDHTALLFFFPLVFIIKTINYVFLFVLCIFFNLFFFLKCRCRGLRCLRTNKEKGKERARRDREREGGRESAGDSGQTGDGPTETTYKHRRIGVT